MNEGQGVPFIDKDTGLVSNGCLYLCPIDMDKDNQHLLVVADKEKAYEETLEAIELFPGDDFKQICDGMFGAQEGYISTQYSQSAIALGKLKNGFRDDKNNICYTNNGYYGSQFTTNDYFVSKRSMNAPALNAIRVIPSKNPIRVEGSPNIESIQEELKRTKHLKFAIPGEFQSLTHARRYYHNVKEGLSTRDRILLELFDMNPEDSIKDVPKTKYRTINGQWTSVPDGTEEKFDIDELWKSHIINDNEFFADDIPYYAVVSSHNDGYKTYGTIELFYDPAYCKKRYSYIKSRRTSQKLKEKRASTVEEIKIYMLVRAIADPVNEFMEVYINLHGASSMNIPHGFRECAMHISKIIAAYENYIAKPHDNKQLEEMFTTLETVDYRKVLRDRRLDSMASLQVKGYVAMVDAVLDMYGYRDYYLTGFDSFKPDKKSWLYQYITDKENFDYELFVPKAKPAKVA